MAQLSSSYSSLSRAQLTVEYLHTNSTTHEFLFGALAELVDNARDAGATKMNIFSVPNNNVLGKYLLCFCDDGEGMDPTEVSNVIQFGRSTKRVMDSKMIGQYGNGLKSGSMRIAKDMIMFTKKHGTMSCLFLSRTFHEREGINEVVVPIPSWDVATRKPLSRAKRELEKHQTELQVILKYSPFKSESELFKYFDKIESKGTLVMVYNMKLLDSGETELEPSEDDIVMRELYEENLDDKSIMPERKSFRAYSAILYLDPRMKIYIQGKKVLTRRLGDGLYKPRSYLFTSKRFKTRSEREANKALVEAKSAADKARELETIAKEMQQDDQGISKESRARLRQAQDSALKARTEADMKNQIASTKQKSLKEPKTLTFTFGFNINRRHSYGMFVYNCNRLIKMYEKSSFQSDGKRAYAGIVGFVDVPYLVLEPTHNKQDFADAKEYKHLLRSMGEHLGQYWKDSGLNEKSVDSFWDNFGYISNDIAEEPSDEAKYLRKRAMQLPCTVQCANCLKWRTLPFSAKNIGRTFEDEWTCSMSNDHERNKCSAPEQKSITPVGSLQKQTKTTEEKQRELMADIKKKKEQLNQLDGRSKQWQNDTTDPVQVKRVLEVPPRNSTISARTEKPATKPSTPKQIVSQPPPRSAAQASLRLISQQTQRAPPKQAPPPAATKRTPAPKQVSLSSPKQLTRTISAPVKSTTKPTAKLTPIARRTSVDSSHTNRSSVTSSNKREHPVAEKEVFEVPLKRKREEVTSTQDIQEPEECHSDNSENTQNDDAVVQSKLSKYKKGSKVEVFIKPRWYFAKVVAVKHSKNSPAKVKVKFDNYQKDKFDKWYDETNDELKLLNEDYPMTEDAMDNSPSSTTPSSTTTVDMPSPSPRKPGSISSPSTGTSLEDTVISLDKMLRSCISYILVPEFPTTGYQLETMSLEELLNFPLDKLFDVHSDSMRTIMDEKTKSVLSKKLSEQESELAESKRRESEYKTTLSNLRRTAAKLIRALNENPEESTIAPNDDTEKVDTLLEAIAAQAVASDAS
ncbi:ATPase MORC2-like [Dendronephthya gigantea]|uniref:ATPase MORC2-like n=1 Tax=Dendronephthya gigantea TaxID=151771 RepID=UPI00106C3D8D|nr:ATPase MORC2-like [Dendronephthya gigantea]